MCRVPAPHQQADGSVAVGLAALSFSLLVIPLASLGTTCARLGLLVVVWGQLCC